MYFEGQGKVFVASVANGVPGAFRWVGDCNQLQLQLQTQNDEEIYESYSGNKLLAQKLSGQKQTNVQFTLREWLVENLALGFYGKSATIASGDVTGEALPADLAQGDIARLQYPQVSTVQVSDSASTPAQLVENTDYRVNAAYGSIEFIGDLSGYTGPFTVDYSYGGGQNVAMFSQAAQERWIRFEGLNRADNMSPVLVELYRVQTDPVSQADLISDSVGDLQISGGALYDATKENDSDLGTFGRIIYPAAAA